MATISNPAKTYTIPDFIEQGQSDDLTYTNFSIIRNSTIGEFADINILDFYISEIKSICLRVETFSEDEISKYKYFPDLLAYDIYGSTQLDFILLIVNGIVDPKEFDFKRGYLLIPPKSKLFTILDEILNSESKWIKLV